MTTIVTNICSVLGSKLGSKNFIYITHFIFTETHDKSYQGCLSEEQDISHGGPRDGI